MLNLEEFDKTIMRTRESTLDFHLTEDDADRLIAYCDAKYCVEKPLPTSPGPDVELRYFGVTVQIYIVK